MNQEKEKKKTYTDTDRQIKKKSPIDGVICKGIRRNVNIPTALYKGFPVALSQTTVVSL